MNSKQQIRQQIALYKRMLTEGERREATRAVFEAVEQLPAFIMAEHIMIYHSLPDELSTREFIAKWAGRKRFYLPRVNGVNLEVLPYDRTRLHLGAFHIEEPDGDEPVDPRALDLILVPAVAIDRRGNRVGRGKGFYDRLLAETRATTVGVIYDFQLVEDACAEEHDVPLRVIVTERRTIVP